MSLIVTTAKQACSNILKFEDELQGSSELQDRLSFARAWYAVRDEDGVWRFGPSKFIGYQKMTAKEYLDGKARDGRRTEAQLAQWFTEVPDDTELYETLSDALFEVLAEYGKTPSSKMRISVPDQVYEASEYPDDSETTLTDLLIKVAKSLPKGEIKRLKESI